MADAELTNILPPIKTVDLGDGTSAVAVSIQQPFSTGRAATFTVATVDATTLQKNQADYICVGVPATDLAAIQAGIDAHTIFSGHIKVIGANLYLADTLVIPTSNMTFDFEGVNIIFSGTGVCLDLNNQALTYNLDANHIRGGRIVASSGAITSGTATALRIRGSLNSWVDIAFSDFKAGASVELVANAAAGDYVESGEWWFNIRDCKTGIRLTGDSSISYNHLRKFEYVVSDNTMAGCSAIDATANTQDALGWMIDEFYLWPAIDGAFYGINGGGLIDTSVEYTIVDALVATFGDGFILMNNVDPSVRFERIDNVQGEEAMRVDLAWITKHYDFETQVPTLGWTTDDTTPANSYGGPMAQICHTTVGANERGLQQCVAAMMSEGVTYSSINWGQAKAFVFYIMAGGTDAQALRRFQVKPAAGEGILAGVGLGIEVQNLALYGECYGAARGTVNLTTALTQWATYQIIIAFYPDSRVQWYVNGVLVGTYTTVANIPTGTVASNYLVHSIINGAGGGVDAMLGLGNLKILGKRA